MTDTNALKDPFNGVTMDLPAVWVVDTACLR